MKKLITLIAIAFCLTASAQSDTTKTKTKTLTDSTAFISTADLNELLSAIYKEMPAESWDILKKYIVPFVQRKQYAWIQKK